jgi:hypothetical protein
VAFSADLDSSFWDTGWESTCDSSCGRVKLLQAEDLTRINQISPFDELPMLVLNSEVFDF